MTMTWRSNYLATVGLLRTRRKELNISQETAAKKIGISRRSMIRRENGEGDFSAPQLFKLAELVGAPIVPNLAHARRRK